MKLYLSSYRLGNSTNELKLMAAGPKCGIILNALDHSPEARTKVMEREISGLEELGFKVDELDLREFFDKNEAIKNKLKEYDLLWITGGNAFVLNAAIRFSGFKKYIREVLNEGELVYAGYSAGAVVAGPSLKGIELVDDPKDLSHANYPDDKVIWEGLGLVDYSIAPHYKSDHPESKLIDNVVTYFKQQKSFVL